MNSEVKKTEHSGFDLLLLILAGVLMIGLFGKKEEKKS